MPDTAQQTTFDVAINKIDRPAALRQRPINQKAVETLKQGLPLHQVPILVKKSIDGRFDLIDGQHRLEAALALNWSNIRAICVSDGDDLEIVGLLNNVGRRNLSASEIMAILTKRAEKGGAAPSTATQLAEMLGISTTKVKRAKALTRLCDAAQRAHADKTISDDLAYEISKTAPESQPELVQLAVDGATRDELRSKVNALRKATTPRLTLVPDANIDELGQTPHGIEATTSAPSVVLEARGSDVIGFERTVTDDALAGLEPHDRCALIDAVERLLSRLRTIENAQGRILPVVGSVA